MSAAIAQVTVGRPELYMPKVIATIRKVLLEGTLVGLTCAAAAVTANRLSPRGLELARNYFLSTARGREATTAASNTGRTIAGNTKAHLELLEAKLHEEGLQTIESDQVSQLLRDPGFEQNWVIFLDARTKEEYQHGHIPVAYECDYYHVTDHLDSVLPMCLRAEKIVVYCNGENCDASELAAIFLRDSALIPREKLFVYAGGWTEWNTRNLPVEIGHRGSGELRNVDK